MAFFEFLSKHPDYQDQERAIPRLSRRYEFLVAPFEEDLRDARVLDLGAHDGRWSYALAASGAEFVHGVEGRQSLIDRFEYFPDDDVRPKVKLEQGDFFEVLERLVRKGRTLDVIAAYGIFYHITDHYRLLTLMAQLQPKLIVIDGMFVDAKSPTVQFSTEKTEKNLNSISRVEGQTRTMVGTTSRRWVDVAAETLGYSTDWAKWNKLKPNQRYGVWDYFGDGPKRRGTVALRPKQAQD